MSSKNYIVINGKKVELTKEQPKALGIETRKNPFNRVATGDVYYRITEYGDVDDSIEDSYDIGQNLYNEVNYSNDDSFANQLALHQLLYRNLLKFVYNNGYEDTQE